MEYDTLTIEGKAVKIKDAEEQELTNLVEIYKQSFKNHNVFERSDNEILEYLKESHLVNSKMGGGYILTKTDDKIIGCILVRKLSGDLSGRHELWRYNHIAVIEDYKSKGIGSYLIKTADKKIKSRIDERKIDSVKIELGLAETEEELLEFYKKNGFELEGQLKSHYRHGEKTYLLGKELP